MRPTVLPDHELVPKHGTAVVFMIVRRPDGGPTGYPMTGLFSDGNLELTMYRKSAKAKLLMADDRVCCVLADPHVPWRGVALYGRAALAPSRGFASSTTDARGSAVDVPDEVLATVRDRLESQKRVVFRIEVERVRELGRATP